METIYYILGCIAIVGIVAWGALNDDLKLFEDGEEKEYQPENTSKVTPKKEPKNK